MRLILRPCPTLSTLLLASCMSGPVPLAAFRAASPPADLPRLQPAPQTAARAASPAAGSYHERSGPYELALGGAGVSNDKVDAGSGQLAASFGRYFSECFEVLLRQNASFEDAGPGDSESWTGASRVAADFHLPFGNFVPYVGVNLGAVYGSGIDDSLLAGPEAGIRCYVKPDVFVLPAGEYQFFFDGHDSLDEAFDDGQILYGLSLGVRF
jgi:hypothetical protein